jgi:alanine racemase
MKGWYTHRMRATRAIIHLDRFRRNLQAVRERVGPKPGICVPVKADAYGHGALRIARAALDAGAVVLAVAAVSEGAELRAAGIDAPILLLSIPAPEEFAEVASLGLVPLVSDGELIRGLGAAAEREGKALTVHLKIDTGMGRMGCRAEEAAALAGLIAQQKHLVYGGTATHLSVADSTEGEDLTYTQSQLTRFREAVEAIRRGGFDPGLVHAANSGAVAFHEDAWFDLVRPGILLYGYGPGAALPGVSPVMELQTRIVFMKRVRAGEAVSYGRTWTAPRETVIATLPVGYGDGLPRALSGNFSVSIAGKPYPLAGRICMDQCMVDLGPHPLCRRWDPVEVFGPGALSAEDIAQRLHTISYEILCGINKRVPRVYELNLTRKYEGRKKNEE